jgi:DNA (cytosine-5)-methyltransferase 1
MVDMKQIKFIEVFAGIGGIRLGFERAGCKCVWANDYDKYCYKTYTENFGNGEFVLGDIRKIRTSEIPEFDILVGGFPCQPFSIAGVSKKNSLGKPHGFKDKTQGTLFHEIVRILNEKRPEAFFLENVKNLQSHDHGKTFEIIKNTLEGLGYSVYYKVINAKLLLPQNRERIFIIGFKDRDINFEFPEVEDLKPKLNDILEKAVPEKYTLTNHLWRYLQDYAKKQKAKGNGFGFGLADLNSYSRTLSARYYKDGSEILIPQNGKNPRRLTPRECARLQGFPDSFKITVSDTSAYKQFGNAVAVPVIEILAKSLIKSVKEKPKRQTPYLIQKRLIINS